jgi:hypothetical protein
MPYFPLLVRSAIRARRSSKILIGFGFFWESSHLRKGAGLIGLGGAEEFGFL